MSFLVPECVHDFREAHDHHHPSRFQHLIEADCQWEQIWPRRSVLYVALSLETEQREEEYNHLALPNMHTDLPVKPRSFSCEATVSLLLFQTLLLPEEVNKGNVSPTPTTCKG